MNDRAPTEIFSLPPPGLVPMTRIVCEVGLLTSLGATPRGECRYVPLGGGTVQGPEDAGRTRHQRPGSSRPTIRSTTAASSRPPTEATP